MFTEVEKRTKIICPNAIRFLGLRKSSAPKTLDEFIVKLFTDYNENFNSVYARSRVLQESKGKRRSFSDIYALCKYYIPNCTAEDVMRVLVEIIGFKNGFRSSPCNIMKKRAFYYAKDKSPAIYDASWYKDEFNHYYEEYQDYFKKK